MYKAMVIDDDRGVLENICSIFDWKSLNVTEIIKLYDASNLVDKIMQESPDIVMIDIELGDVSGLDVIEECKKRRSNALFVIISGHYNFSYAKIAIKLDVVYFLSKPIMECDVLEATEKIINRLNLKVTRSSELIDDVSVFLSSKLEFNSLMQKSQLNPSGHYRFIVAEAKGGVLEEISQLCLGESLCLKYKIGIGKYLLIVDFDNYTKEQEARLRSVSITRRISIGVSDDFYGVDDVYSYFKQAYILSFGEFIYNRNDVFVNEKIDKTVSEEFIQNSFRFLEGMKPENINEMEAFLKNIPEFFKTNKFDFEHVMFFYNGMVYKINSLTRNKQNSEFISVLSVEDMVAEYSSLRELCDELWVLIKEIFTDSVDVQSDSNVFEKILQYINNNFNQRLSLEKLGRQFGVSVSYICKHFKEEHDTTFLEYLKIVRMEQAKNMLCNAPFSIAEIVEMVGYFDYYYFNKTFKAYTGYTPKQFKSIQRQGNANEN